MQLYPIDSSVLFLAGCLLVLLVLVRQFRRRAAAGAARPATAAGPTTPHPPAQSAPRDRWEVQMRELARELNGQLATRAAIVEQLLREADQRAQQLRLLLAQPHEPKTTPGDATTETDDEPSSAAGEFFTAPRCSYGRLPLDRQVAIYALTDAGYTTAAVAHRLDVPVGDVELMLSLREAT